MSEEYKGGMVLFFPDDPHSFGYVDLGGGYLICAPSGIPAMGLPREAIDKLPHVAAIIAERDELKRMLTASMDALTIGGAKIVWPPEGESDA